MHEANVPGTAAAGEARENFASNLAALRSSQGRTAEQVSAAGLAAGQLDLEWVYGRDGHLTALLGRQWLAGCSVPRSAAEAVLTTMAPRGTVLCFLSPNHAAQVKVALGKLRAEQGMIVIVPAVSELWLMLHCASFADEMLGGRLWWVCGDEWRAELQRLLDENEGLPVAQQLIRTPLLPEEQSRELVAGAQEMFARVVEQRTSVIARLNAEWRPTQAARMCVIAPSLFRLWDCDGAALAEAMAGEDIVKLDPDCPACASNLALARAAHCCRAVVAANATRADLPAVLPVEMPVISWVTTPRIPAFSSVGPRDALILMEETWREVAVSAGWPAERLAVAGRPHVPPRRAVEPSTVETTVAHSPARELAMIADTSPVVPAPEFELSSHRLLWELIAAELLRDPFAVAGDLWTYLSERMRRLEVAEVGFDRRVFIDGCIVPAYQQGIARLLNAAGLPLRLWGKGWGAIDGLGKLAAGEIGSWGALRQATDGAMALVHVWPIAHAHPVEAMGRPVVRAFCNRRETFLGAAKLALAGRLAPPEAPGVTLSAGIVRSLLASVARE